MLISTLIFALIAIVLQPIASGVVQEKHVSYLENILGESLLERNICNYFWIVGIIFVFQQLSDQEKYRIIIL